MMTTCKQLVFSRITENWRENILRGMVLFLRRPLVFSEKKSAHYHKTYIFQDYQACSYFYNYKNTLSLSSNIFLWCLTTNLFVLWKMHKECLAMHDCSRMIHEGSLTRRQVARLWHPLFTTNLLITLLISVGWLISLSDGEQIGNKAARNIL